MILDTKERGMKLLNGGPWEHIQSLKKRTRLRLKNFLKKWINVQKVIKDHNRSEIDINLM